MEGPQAVRELLRVRPETVRALYVDEEHLADGRHDGLWRSVPSVQPVPCSSAVLTAMADTPHPQGVLAVAATVDVPLGTALDAVTGGTGVLAVLEQVRDPGNAGTVLRAADAFGADAVVLTDASVDVHGPKVVRSTVGSLFHLPVVTGVPLVEVADACRERGIRLLAADGSGATSLPTLAADGTLARPHAWVFGNEAHGLTPDALALVDDVVAIPIVRAESLNLAMAATVCLHTSAGVTRA